MKYIILFYAVQLKTQLLYCPNIANYITAFIDKRLLTNTIVKEKQDLILFFFFFFGPLHNLLQYSSKNSPVGFFSLVHHVVMLYYLQGFFLCFFYLQYNWAFYIFCTPSMFLCLAVFWNTLDLVNKHPTIIIIWHAKSYIEFSLRGH